MFKAVIAKGIYYKWWIYNIDTCPAEYIYLTHPPDTVRLPHADTEKKITNWMVNSVNPDQKGFFFVTIWSGSTHIAITGSARQGWNILTNLKNLHISKTLLLKCQSNKAPVCTCMP